MPGLSIASLVVSGFLSTYIPFFAIGQLQYSIIVHLFSLAFGFRLVISLIWTNYNVSKRLNGSRQKSSTNIRHAIVIPNYKEDVATLEATLNNLAKHRNAKSTYDVFLAMEESESRHELKARQLLRKYGTKFNQIKYFSHPAGIKGEVAGKGSNLCWASKKISEFYLATKTRNVVLTVLDADTWHSEEYFQDLKPLPDTIFVAPVVFNRNSSSVPTLVRNADALWACAGVSGMHPLSMVMPPTSTYSMTLDLIREVGFWDPGSEAIGEDLHMYLKCFFHTRGKLKAQPIWAPANHCNIHTESSDELSYHIGFLKARYNQGLRHMWGCLDAGYAIRSFFSSTKSKKLIDEYVFDAQYVLDLFSDIGFALKAFLVFTRLFEAHFLPAHLVILTILDQFSILARSDNQILKHIFNFLGASRIISFVLMVSSLLLQEQLNLIVRSAHGSRRKYPWKNVFSYMLFPVSGVLFGVLPAVHAQFSHFWTVNIAYKVSLKPSLNSGN